MSIPPLSENEKKILQILLAMNGQAWIDEIIQVSNLPKSTVMSIIELLKSKGLVREQSVYEEKYVLSKSGEETLKEGFPEEALIEELKQGKPVPIKDVSIKYGRKASIAIGELKKKGAIRIKDGQIFLEKNVLEEIRELKTILEKIGRREEIPREKNNLISELARRGLIERKLVKKTRITAVQPIAKQVIEKHKETVARLTSTHIISGEWRKIVLKEYNVEAYPPRLHVGIEHFLNLFIEKIRNILFEMGFKEVYSPMIEQEFWNFDVLFQAQDHPSREIHDTFWLEYSVDKINANKKIVERTKTVHETGGKSGSKGWGGYWSENIAKRLILRTQMTAVTARSLSTKPRAPFRIFSIGKVYRPDAIDSRHLPEFTQFDGIISEEDMSFSKLLGILKEFFERLGFEKIKFKPAYFPFTEPSVEGYLWMENKGWVEVFGAGMFRPEVLEILDYPHPVGAWGMGIDRIAMRILGIDDIRVLYTRDINQIKNYYPKALKALILLEKIGK